MGTCKVIVAIIGSHRSGELNMFSSSLCYEVGKGGVCARSSNTKVKIHLTKSAFMFVVPKMEVLYRPPFLVPELFGRFAFACCNL